MKCPQCDNDNLEAANFCGACGASLGPKSAVSAPRSVTRGSISVFALPVSSGARVVRVALVLTINAALMGGGVAMIFAYLNARDEAATRSVVVSPDGGASAVPAEVSQVPASHGDAGSARASQTSYDAQMMATPSQPKAARSTTVPTRSSSRRSSRGSKRSTKRHVVADAGASRPPRAKPSTPTTGPTKQEIAKLRSLVSLEMLKSRQPLMRCASAGADAPRVKGTVKIRFLMLGDGRLSNISIASDSTRSSQTANCVVRIVRGWRFPPTPRRQTIRFVWPFSF